MLFQKALRIWLYTVLAGAFISGILTGVKAQSPVSIIVTIFLIYGAIFSSPGIILNWIGLRFAKQQKHPYDRTFILSLSNLLANGVVLLIAFLALGYNHSSYMHILSIVWPFVLSSFIFLYRVSAKVIYQPYPEFREELSQTPQ